MPGQDITLYVHIGTHKTGTSAIQEFYFDNAVELREQGYVYPRRPTYLKGHHPVAWALGVNHPRADGSIDAGELFAHFFDVVDKDEATALVISSEGFEFLHAPENLAAVTGGRRVVVLAYLRRQDRYLASIYNHHLRIPTWRYAESMSRFYRDEDLDGRFDYAGMLRRWVDVFGPESVLPVSYDRIAKLGHSVVGDFSSHLGVDTTGMRGLERVVNPSLGPYESEVLRFLNERDVDTDTHLADVAFLRWASGRGILAARYGPPPAAVPPELRREVLDRYRVSNRKLIDTFPALDRDFATDDAPDADDAAMPPADHMLEALRAFRAEWESERSRRATR